MNLSVRRSIVLWYTVWMIVLIAIVFILIFSGSGYVMERRTKASVIETVNEAVDTISGDDGHIDYDDIDFRSGGVYLALFDSEGFRIAGMMPEDISYRPFSEGSLQTVPGRNKSWYIYDSCVPDASGNRIWVRGVINSYDMSAMLSSMQWVIILVIPVLVALAVSGGYLIVRRSFRPIDRLIDTASGIAAGDDLKKRIGLGEGNGEIYRAASAFDMMMDRIEESFRKEKQFTSDASHELRTPISVIMAEAGYAKDHPDNADKSLDVIISQAGRMSSLVSELLYIARADKGTLKIEKEDVDIGELVMMTAETMSDRATERGISIECETLPDLVVPADRDMIIRVLINLISNAVTYGRDDGHILIKTWKEDGYAVISVKDDGIGIGEEHLGRIWDRFYQADSSRSSEHGTGLGLSIVKEIVRLHDGFAAVDSREGEGSVFTVRLPLL